MTSDLKDLPEGKSPASLSASSGNPTSKDGALICPANHAVLHENDAFRVVDVFIAARTEETPHTHDLPSWMVVETARAIEVLEVREADEPGEPSQVTKVFERLCGGAPDDPWLVQEMPAERLHFVRNKDTAPYLAARLEIKRPGLRRVSPPPLAPGGSVSLAAMGGPICILALVRGTPGAPARLTQHGQGVAPLARAFEPAGRPLLWVLRRGDGAVLCNQSDQTMLLEIFACTQDHD